MLDFHYLKTELCTAGRETSCETKLVTQLRKHAFAHLRTFGFHFKLLLRISSFYIAIFFQWGLTH